MVLGSEREGDDDLPDSQGRMGPIVGRVAVSAIFTSAVGLFVPFFSVLHLTFNIWRVHNACSVLNAALRQGPTTMTMMIPPMFGSVHHTCAVVATVCPVLVCLGLLGVVAGMVALFWKYGTTEAV